MKITEIKILGLFFLSLLATFFWGFKSGVKSEKEKHGLIIIKSKKTIEINEKKLDTIRSESDTSAVYRFLKEFGTIR
jgi:hypothetical protein